MKLLRCKSMMGSQRCELSRRHRGFHTATRPGYTRDDGWIVGPMNTGWADSIDRIRESGLFAPWIADALDIPEETP